MFAAASLSSLLYPALCQCCNALPCSTLTVSARCSSSMLHPGPVLGCTHHSRAQRIPSPPALARILRARSCARWLCAASPPFPRRAATSGAHRPQQPPPSQPGRREMMDALLLTASGCRALASQALARRAPAGRNSKSPRHLRASESK
jgi:hypothetical protein